MFPRTVRTVQPMPISPRTSVRLTPRRAARVEMTGFALVPTVEQHRFWVPGGGGGGDDQGAAAARVCKARKQCQ